MELMETKITINSTIITDGTNIVKPLNNDHPFCRAVVASIEGWPLLIKNNRFVLSTLGPYSGVGPFYWGGGAYN